MPNARPDRGGIYIANLKTPGVTRVVDTMSNAVYSDPGFLLFVRDETLLAQRFDLSGVEEWTVECNPATLRET